MCSDREKNSAVNESILNELNIDITGLLVPKLIFGSSKTTQDLSYYSSNFGKKMWYSWSAHCVLSIHKDYKYKEDKKTFSNIWRGPQAQIIELSQSTK